MSKRLTRGPFGRCSKYHNQHWSPIYLWLPTSFLHHKRLFGHIVHSQTSPNEVHHRSVAAAIQKPPSDWYKNPVMPGHVQLRRTWSHWVCFSSAWKKATSRENWRSVVDTATLKKSMSWEEKEEKKEEKKRKELGNIFTLFVCLFVCLSVCLLLASKWSWVTDSLVTYQQFHWPKTGDEHPAYTHCTAEYGTFIFISNIVVALCTACKVVSRWIFWPNNVTIVQVFWTSAV